jgi:alpha-N-acetylglucosamine transferase
MEVVPGNKGERMRTAYVTTLCNGDAYVPGVEALGRSIDRTQTPHPKIVLVTPDVPEAARQRLREKGWQTRDIEPISNPTPEGELMFSRFRNTFTKLRAWSATEFDKLVCLDADTIVLQNIDELFERPGIAAAPDFLLPDRFNSGVMVIEPSQATLDRMLDALFSSGSYDGGDQGFLNTFYPDWFAGPGAHRLPAGYNMHQFIYQFLRAHPSLLPQIEHEAKVIHYTVQKPWLNKTTLAGASETWWDAYYEVHPEEATEWKRRMHAAEDWSFDAALKAFLPS